MDASQLRFYHALSAFWMYTLPGCKGSTDFKAAFKSYESQSEITAKLVDNLQRTRNEVLNTLCTACPHETRIRAVEDYLAFLYQLFESLVKHQGPFKSDRDLVFEWRLHLSSPTPTLQYYRSNDTVFELIMMLHLKASLHYHLARQYLDTDLIANLTEAGKQLVISAGILDLIEANIKSNKWNRTNYSTTPAIPNPAETSVAVISGLSLYYRSLAQILAIIKGVSNLEKPTPLAVRTRLAVGVINLSAAALRSLESSASGVGPTASAKFQSWLNPELLVRVAVNREVFTALAYFYQNKLLTEKQEIGMALAYCQFAQSHLIEQPSNNSKGLNYHSPGLPKIAGSFSHLASITSYLHSLLNESLVENDRTNRFVTFQVIPKTLSDLPPLPAEAVIMNSTVYKEPEVDPSQLAVFVLPEKKSFFGSLFGTSKSKSSSSTTSTTTNGEETTTTSTNTTTTDQKEGTAVVESVPLAGPGPGPGPVAYFPPPSQSYPPPPYNHNNHNNPIPNPQQLQYNPPSHQIQYPSNTTLYPSINLTANPPPANPPMASAPGMYYTYQTSSSLQPPLTDEEYARQLQQQYNLEAANHPPNNNHNNRV